MIKRRPVSVQIIGKQHANVQYAYEDHNDHSPYDATLNTPLIQLNMFVDIKKSKRKHTLYTCTLNRYGRGIGHPILIRCAQTHVASKGGTTCYA